MFLRKKIQKKMTNLIRSNFQDHPFHLVSPSPWPFVWFGKSLCRVKLSNSGDTLKPLIPNLVWKYINGRSNLSCTVISQWILESWIGNRGSKSVFCNLLRYYFFYCKRATSKRQLYRKKFYIKMYSNGLCEKLSDQNPS